jgi:hypothetical protein
MLFIPEYESTSFIVIFHFPSRSTLNAIKSSQTWKRSFEKKHRGKKNSYCHPLILSLKNDLKFHRDSIDSTPRGEIELTLPISVQTATTSIKHNGVISDDGTMVLVAHLMAYQNSYTVKQKCTTVDFKKC